MFWTFEVYRIMAYRRMADLQAEAEWARKIAQAGPWRPEEDAKFTRGQDDRGRPGVRRLKARTAAKAVRVANGRLGAVATVCEYRGA